MEYRILGKSGLKISRLGFGGIPIQRIDAAGTKVLMHQLKDAGINYIDLMNIRGEVERDMQTRTFQNEGDEQMAKAS